MNKIYMIGDSTMQFNNVFSYPQTGWGQVLNLFTKPGVSVFDFAKNGRSTKSFIEQKRFEEVYNLLEENDYVICQFSHNDEKVSDPLRYTEPYGSFVDNLKFFLDKVKEKKANILFATPITRRLFKNGVLTNTHGDYPDAMKKFCKDNNCVCIDLNQMTIDLYNQLGEEKTKKFHMIFPANTFDNYPEGKEDNSHLRYEGAFLIANLFVSALSKTNSSLKELMLDLNVREEIDYAMLKD